MKSKLSPSKKQQAAEDKKKKKKKGCILSPKGWAELKSGGIRESLAAISELQLRLVKVPGLRGTCRSTSPFSSSPPSPPHARAVPGALQWSPDAPVLQFFLISLRHWKFSTLIFG